MAFAALPSALNRARSAQNGALRPKGERCNSAYRAHVVLPVPCGPSSTSTALSQANMGATTLRWTLPSARGLAGAGRPFQQQRAWAVGGRGRWVLLGGFGQLVVQLQWRAEGCRGEEICEGRGGGKGLEAVVAGSLFLVALARSSYSCSD